MMKGNNPLNANKTPTIGDMLERIKEASRETKESTSGSPRKKLLEEELLKMIDQLDGIPHIHSQRNELTGNIHTQIYDKSQTDTTKLDNVFSRMIELQKQRKQSSDNKNKIECLNAEYSNLMDFVDNISDYPKLSGESEVSSKGE